MIHITLTLNEALRKYIIFKDDVTRAQVEVEYKGVGFIWEGVNQARAFECKVPKSKFQEKFHWFYLYENGIYEPITPESMFHSGFLFNRRERKKYFKLYTINYGFLESSKQTLEPQSYIDRVRIKFPSRNITHVVCAGYLLKDGTSYNNTVAVKIKGMVSPVM